MPDKKQQNRQIDPKQLSQLISYLDGYSALSVADPSRIQRIVKRNSDDPDISAVWREIGNDVQDIAALPSSSEEIMKLSGRLGILRPVIMFLGLIVFVIYFVLEGSGIMKRLGELGVVVFLAGFVGAYFAGFAVYFIYNRKLTNLVNAYFNEHGNEVARQRRHIKVVNQRLIDKLAAILRMSKTDPDKYRFALLHKDYANINVVKEDKNEIYTVTVKGSRKSPQAEE